MKNAKIAQLICSLILFLNQACTSTNTKYQKTGAASYCSYKEEAKIYPLTDGTFNVEKQYTKVFAPDNQECVSFDANKSNRNWKVINVNEFELKFHSTSGCKEGLYKCSFKRLDH